MLNYLQILATCHILKTIMSSFYSTPISIRKITKIPIATVYRTINQLLSSNSIYKSGEKSSNDGKYSAIYSTTYTMFRLEVYQRDDDNSSHILNSKNEKNIFYFSLTNRRRYEISNWHVKEYVITMAAIKKGLETLDILWAKSVARHVRYLWNGTDCIVLVVITSFD